MKTSGSDSDFSRYFESGSKSFGRRDFEDSLNWYWKAYQINPNHAVLQANVAAVMYELGRYAESEAHAKRSIELSPTYNRPHITLGVLRLLHGDFTNGWPEYEWVGSLAEKFRKLPADRKWQGESLQNRRVVVIDEQGYGDTIQFLRFVPALIKSGAEVFLDVKEPLRPLIRNNPHVGSVLNPGKPAEFSKWTRLLSLPRLTGVTLGDLGQFDKNYLSAPPLDSNSRIHQEKGTKVGLIWKGSDANSRDPIRSLRLEELAPLFTVPDVTFFHLQNQSFREEITAFGLNNRIVELHDEIENFADLAAAIDAMDLVVTIDTAVAHLAGALGKPTLCLLSFVPDWRWELDAKVSSWYPKTRLFRQQKPNDWSSPVQEVTDFLKKRLKKDRKFGELPV